MKIAFVIPFYYAWGNYSNVKSHYEYLQILGHQVDIFNRSQKPVINYNNYDQILLLGAGSQITETVFESIKVPVISFGLSDPNLFSIDHSKNSDFYCTNDLKISRKLACCSYYQTTCDSRYHKNLNLGKTTDILVYGIGRHPFVKNRNEVVNDLRNRAFKIKVFGRNWDNHPDTYGHIEGIEFIKEINKAHLVLDISNETTAWPHRILEASACGTPVITIDREDTRAMFEEGTEILLYKNFNNLVANLEYSLRHPLTIKEIGKRVQKRCYKDHDISVRIKELITIMESL